MKNLLWLVSVFFATQTVGQELSFTLPTYNQYYLNPSRVGLDTFNTATLQALDHHPGMENLGAFTFLSSYAHNINRNSTVYGSYMFDRDHNKMLRWNDFKLGFSHKFKLSRTWRLIAAAEAGYYARKLDPNKITYGNWIQPRHFFLPFLPIELKDGPTVGLDLSAGVTFVRKNSTFGFSAHHINEPNISYTTDEYRLPMKYGVQASHLIEIPRIDLHINLIAFYTRQRRSNQLSFATYVQYKKFEIGHLMRSQTEHTFSAALKLRVFDLTYGYSMNKTVFTRDIYTKSHELGLRIRLPY